LFAVFGTGDPGNLKYSDDDGISWNTAKGSASAYTINKVVSDGKNQLVAYSAGVDLYYSGDNGETWKTQPQFIKDKSINMLTYTPSGKLFMITFDGTLYYSADNGNSWSILTVKKGGGIDLLRPVKEGKSGEFYALLNADGMYKSIDNGLTWNKLPDIAGGDGWDGIYGFYINPENGWLYESAGSATSIYLSKDGGNTYSRLVLTGIDAYTFAMNNGVLYFEGNGSIYKVGGAAGITEIISTGISQAADGDFIISNSGNILFKDGSPSFLRYVKP